MRHVLVFLLAIIVLNASFAEEFCENAYTTLDINSCKKQELDAYLRTLDQYIQKSKERYSEDEIVLRSIDEAQLAWESYRKAHCASVYDAWRDGTIRTLMSLSCSINLTKQRTHNVWESYLTYMDSTPPVLPEPKLVEE